MTIHLADVAVYQGDLDPDAVAAAGFGAINLKISHGLGQQGVHPQAASWVARWNALGREICTFHFLTGAASGTLQARYAYDRLTALGLTQGTAHQVDCESDATLTVVREYVTEMQRLLGRPIVVYTGDWWWQPKGWNVSDLTPYVWAAPNAGYLKDYPGDASVHWAAGWGGWPVLSVMQYAVSLIGVTNVSKSAIRDRSVWAALRGVNPVAINSLPASTSLVNEINWLAPNRDKSEEGTIGDAAHQREPSDHNPDESGNAEGWDSDSIDEVHARDVDSSGPWPPGWSMQRIVDIIVARSNAHLEQRIRYIIYNRRIWSWYKDQLVPEKYEGGDPHTGHAHFSFEYGSGSGTSNPENITAPWGIRAARELETQEWDEMATKAEVKAAVVEAFAVRHPLALARLKELGWGGDAGMSIDQLLAYIMEGTVASGARDVDGDGVLDGLSLQTRMDRLEENDRKQTDLLQQILAKLNQG